MKWKNGFKQLKKEWNNQGAWDTLKNGLKTTQWCKPYCNGTKDGITYLTMK